MGQRRGAGFRDGTDSNQPTDTTGGHPSPTTAPSKPTSLRSPPASPNTTKLGWNKDMNGVSGTSGGLGEVPVFFPL
ncbi:MAG: hypothetical protein ACYDAQ_13830, partial [Mycobacteriales bacterium]